MAASSSGQRGIIALTVVLGVGVFALGAVFAVMTAVLGGVAKNSNSVSGDQIFYTAESGMAEGTYQYLGSVASYTGGDPSLINNAVEGDITVTDIGWPYVAVRGVAENARTLRAVVHTLTIFPEGFAFDHAVYAQYFLTLGGSIEINGSIFANDGIEFNGNNATVNGDAYTPGVINDPDNITGNVVEGVDPIPAPSLDTAPYRDEAIASGTLFSTAADAEAYMNNQVRSAVVFVDDVGQTKIQGNGTNLTGSLVTMGDLDLTGGIVTAYDGHAAIIVHGDLKIAGGATINGVVYVTGTTSFGGGNNTINGSLISAGGASVTDLTGNATINYDPDLADAWKDLLGLDTVSSEPPKVILWGEE